MEKFDKIFWVIAQALIVIGALEGGNNAEGQAFVYQYISGVWEQLGQNIYGVNNASK
ncbi:hypothetical protein [Lacinutrix himadriensis]|uniref:hypothetical protein n=1 Tax=Lacinutrix himadriensis TaxID=641549 RepID=UPI000A8F36AF|nr:hypothetical protein [Lacinutrix himadriensis]